MCVCVCVATSNSKQHDTEAEAPCSCTCMLVLLLSLLSLNMSAIYYNYYAPCIMHHASCVWLVAIACAWDWDFGIGIRTTDIRMRTKPAPDPNQAGLGSEPKQTRIRVGVRGLLFTMIMLLGYCDWPVAACYTRHSNSNSSCSNMQLASCLDKSKKKTKGAC